MANLELIAAIELITDEQAEVVNGGRRGGISLLPMTQVIKDNTFNSTATFYSGLFLTLNF